MPDYAYKALTREGRSIRGVKKAQNEQSAILVLRDEGMYVLSLQEQVDVWWKHDIYIGPKVSLKDFTAFCRQLATLIRAGVAILESIKILTQQSESKPMRQALKQMSSTLAEGMSFSASTAEHPDIFPPIFINMVRAGEVGGNLDEILERIAFFFERENETREKIKSALTYPIVVGIVSVLVMIFLLVKIVPSFVSVFASFHKQLPLPTRIVMDASAVIERGWWAILIIAGAVFGTHLYLKRKPFYQRLSDQMKLRTPVFGMLIKKSLIARLSRTMSSLIKSAVPILEAIDIVSSVVGNRAISEVLNEASNNLQKGSTMSGPIANSKLFPPLVSHMIAIGEETGNLDFMFDKIADFYEAEVSTYADRLKSLIEPMMVIILAVIVGTIVMAVILPEFSLYNTIS
ncbi:type II secretion system F family protein [Sulfoacidibacillus ferrooxidans]|uniref:Type II secretion system protein F n=1 Tax=Sulfoacidibacillus ferrooxidans TaxID=2005001 RepID=A0A9X1V8M9_9BACL|nr:type II secretion system F family protein [Sulfoacidibacillus ferrooxidans]MCI0183781.1 putative type II secretion system protein F [Sulfoacidibacillus ferrooxidans]